MNVISQGDLREDLITLVKACPIVRPEVSWLLISNQRIRHALQHMVLPGLLAHMELSIILWIRWTHVGIRLVKQIRGHIVLGRRVITPRGLEIRWESWTAWLHTRLRILLKPVWILVDMWC